MEIFAFLLKSNASRLRWAVFVSIVSGVSATGLIAMVHHVWEGELWRSMPWAWAFMGTIVLAVGSGVIGQLMVLDLAFRAVVTLRMELCGRILATPLRRLEELGSPRLYATLTEDVNTLSRVLPAIPRVIIDVTTLVAGVGYMAWLSWKAFILVLLFAIVGTWIHKIFLRSALQQMRAGREIYDRVFHSFRALHDGVKQLKLNRQRRTSFMQSELSAGPDRAGQFHPSGREDNRLCGPVVRQSQAQLLPRKRCPRCRFVGSPHRRLGTCPLGHPKEWKDSCESNLLWLDS